MQTFSANATSCTIESRASGAAVVKLALQGLKGFEVQRELLAYVSRLLVNIHSFQTRAQLLERQISTNPAGLELLQSEVSLHESTMEVVHRQLTTAQFVAAALEAELSQDCALIDAEAQKGPDFDVLLAQVRCRLTDHLFLLRAPFKVCVIMRSMKHCTITYSLFLTLYAKIL